MKFGLKELINFIVMDMKNWQSWVKVIIIASVSFYIGYLLATNFI